MKLIKKILRRLIFAYEIHVLSRIFKASASLMAWIYGKGCLLHNSCRFNVPVCIDGAGKVSLGTDVTLGIRKAPMLGNGRILIQARTPESNISIGAGTITSNNISIVACNNISIGDGCQMGDQVMILDCDFHEINPETRNASIEDAIPVVIGKNVWLGSRVIVLKGVHICDHSIIAAGSIVTASIPERSLSAGVPAKVIRSL